MLNKRQRKIAALKMVVDLIYKELGSTTAISSLAWEYGPAAEFGLTDDDVPLVHDELEAIMNALQNRIDRLEKRG